MKKILSFFILAICLFSTSIFKNRNLFMFGLDETFVEKVCFVRGEKFEGEAFENIQCGDKFFVSSSLSNAKENLKILIENADGVEFYLVGYDHEKLLSEAKFEEISKQEIENIMILTGYSPLFQDCVFIDNKKVNMQIAVYDEKMIVGFPMILTGY